MLVSVQRECRLLGANRKSRVAVGIYLESAHRLCFFFSSRRRHTRFDCDWSSDVCSSDLVASAMSSEGCNIEVVLIDTEAHKAIDVFYITKQGSKLNGLEAERLRKRLLGV